MKSGHYAACYNNHLLTEYECESEWCDQCEEEIGSKDVFVIWKKDLNTPMHDKMEEHAKAINAKMYLLWYYLRGELIEVHIE